MKRLFLVIVLLIGLFSCKKDYPVAIEKETSKDTTELESRLVVLPAYPTLIGMSIIKEQREKREALQDSISKSIIEVEDYTIKVSTIVNDSMTFNVAFKSARNDIGIGGIFYWKGKYYNTFQKEEWDGLTKEDRDKFVDEFKSNYLNKDVTSEIINTTGTNISNDDVTVTTFTPNSDIYTSYVVTDIITQLIDFQDTVIRNQELVFLYQMVYRQNLFYHPKVYLKSKTIC